MPFIEKNKIGIWGWSYGGYVTLMALALDYFDAVFQCGIAVSPVTNWMLYGKCLIILNSLLIVLYSVYRFCLCRAIYGSALR